MSYGGHPCGGVAYAASDVGDIPSSDVKPALAVEVSFTTGALETPVWVDITQDVRSWSTTRGRQRPLERFQPGRATIVLGNLERQYDSLYADGPWFGNIKPMRRIRIRETFNGVTFPTFDGFIDRWQLDYPLTGKDATATVVATDGFKVHNRTALPRSVYTTTVDDDAPAVWWRLDETVHNLRQGFALNAGTLEAAGDGTFVGSPEVNGQRIVVNDPGPSLRTRNAQQYDGTPLQGVFLDNSAFSLLSQSVFVVEAWVRLEASEATAAVWTVSHSSNATVHAILGYENNAVTPTDRQFAFLVLNSTFTLFYGVMTPAGSVLPGAINHVVASVESGGQMAIWLNGTRYTTSYPGATATTLAGVTRPTTGHFAVGHENRSGASSSINWGGEIAEVAAYSSGLSDARIAAHYAAGTAPWDGDSPETRFGRVLDEEGWPADLRELDTGFVTLQSAQITGQSVLEHMQKIGESDYGRLFMSRDGMVRFIDVNTLGVQTVVADAVFGDEAGEIGYRGITFDEGDSHIRNRAKVSRLDGVVKTSTSPTSIEEFGTFDYVIEGLLHDDDDWSQEYADRVLADHNLPGRRVTSLSLGPAAPGKAATLYPQMLGRELCDAITVRFRPPGGGDLFQQACVIDGIEHAGRPGGAGRTCRFILSPAPDDVVPVEISLLLEEDGDVLLAEDGEEIEVE